MTFFSTTDLGKKRFSALYFCPLSQGSGRVSIERFETRPECRTTTITMIATPADNNVLYHICVSEPPKGWRLSVASCCKRSARYARPQKTNSIETQAAVAEAAALPPHPTDKTFKITLASLNSSP